MHVDMAVDKSETSSTLRGSTRTCCLILLLIKVLYTLTLTIELSLFPLNISEDRLIWCDIALCSFLAPSYSVSSKLSLISFLINEVPPSFHPSIFQTHIHSCVFFLSSDTAPVPGGPQCTSTSLGCFPWKAGVKFSPSSCSRQWASCSGNS